MESRREYDEPGRLVSETSRSGETVRYRYDDAHSELPATTTDATGSTSVRVFGFQGISKDSGRWRTVSHSTRLWSVLL
ncbi:TPA: hypothetical protein ACJIPC_004404 [Escherichia coli]